jgi:hypothetical protein
MDPLAFQQLQIQLVQANLLSPDSVVYGNNSDDATRDAFEKLLISANLAGRPWQSRLNTLIDFQRAVGQSGITAGAGGSTSVERFDPVKVRETVTLTGKSRARAQLRSMMAEMLGRAPSPGEVEEYVSRLNTAESNDPTVTTYTYQRDGDVSTEVEQTDVDAATIAERYAKKENPEEYREYQALNYYNALAAMMGG